MNGNCGSFADLFVNAMLNQGINQEKEFVQVTTSIFVNNWTPTGNQIDGFDIFIQPAYGDQDDIPSASDVLDLMYSETRDRYVLHEHSQLVDVDGVPGQNESNPRADFGGLGGHTFVRYVVAGQMRWLDPSYGTEYFGADDTQRIIDFEDKSVYGTFDHELENLEQRMGLDLDGDGSITSTDDQTYVYRYEVVKRQRPGIQDVEFLFKENQQ